MSQNHSNGPDRSPLRKWWEDGKIQKYFRISYDVIWNIVLFFLIVGVIGVFFAAGLGAGYFASLVKDEPIRAKAEMQKDIYNYEETSELYFAGDTYLGKIQSDLYREEVPLDQVSDHVVNAVIATEDANFETHDGVVPKAIIRAIFQEVTNANVKTGGSTLTQQLIKNQILTDTVSFERKAKEILLALRLERFFEKEEILEAYLNVVPFGRNAGGRNVAGIETAAQGIFGVSAKELNLPQAAYIAGMPQSPYMYTPFTNTGEVKSEAGLTPGIERMRTVLQRMLEAEMITQAEYDKAVNYDIAANFTEPEPSPVQSYPYIAFEVEKRATNILQRILAEQDGYTKEDLANSESLQQEYATLADRTLVQNGLKVHTTIDKPIYDKMQELHKNYNHYGPVRTWTVTDEETGEEKTIKEPVQVGGMLIENKTGSIISFIGGRDFDLENLNHATDAKRSNGSTMKPLLVYAPAIDLGEANPGSVVADIETAFAGGYTPGNYGGSFHGLTSIRRALAMSYNVPAVKTYADIRNQNPASYLDKMGFTTLLEEDKTNLSTSLGSLLEGVTVEENTNAFATFGNNGKFVDAHMIDKIETKDGDILYEHKSEPVDVFSEQASYLTVDMMRDVLDYGTARYAGNRLKYPGVDWAGKTGTSQNVHDTWFVATNPNVTMGMWMGYDTPSTLRNCGNCSLGYSNRNVKLWTDIVNAASDLNPDLMVPKESFKQPSGIVRQSYCAASGLLPSQLCSEMGLVSSDIYYAKYAPTKRDDSLIATGYVEIGDKAYVAGDSTPPEFTNEGVFFNPEYIERNNYDRLSSLNQLVPNNSQWASVRVPSTDKVPNDGQAPAAPGAVSASGGVLKWSPSGSRDVVGYRIYRAPTPGAGFQLIGNSATNSLGISGKGVYIVRAVDYFGMESGASQAYEYGDFTPDPPPSDQDQDSGNNNNNGNNGNNGNNDNDGTNNNNGNNNNDGNNDNGNNDNNNGSDDNNSGNGNTDDGSTDDNSSGGTENDGSSGDDNSGSTGDSGSGGSGGSGGSEDTDNSGGDSSTDDESSSEG
ncbi:penicillin-binding protein [Pontibacillus sp. ALD_SL1]|uniref:transglycosylase domain-containing protein n=1 Tax=Pontibacillus sp. ALD_SL1 TaxID=2777185 RepID=UPI001A966922|nr:transglycosylase domain-containing protein [Pontibacillus sp. ALD_SL1]QSS99260.1 penicillin-binding protein [Pontibacillus sp. ALD_SL1]